MSTQPETLPIIAWLYHDGKTRAEVPHPLMGSVCVTFERQPYYLNETPLTDHATASARIAELEQQLAVMTADRDSWERQASDRVDDALAFAERAEAAEQQLAQAQKALRQASFALRELLPDDADAKFTVGVIDAALSSSAEESKT